MIKAKYHKLWVDDLRDAPDNTWTIARTAWHALRLMEIHEFDEVSLDHDLASFVGNKELTGRDILNWMIARKLDGVHVPTVVKVHSANPVGCQTMEEDIEKYFNSQN